MEFRQKLSKYAKANPSGNVLLAKSGNAIYREKIQRKNIECFHCKSIFQCKVNENKKYCSENCRRANAGGIRRGSGRGKSGYYKGVYLSSTYELAYLIYNLDHNIHIVRNKEYWKYEYKGKTYKFYPDFRVNGKLVELKSFQSELTDCKISSVDEPIEILYGKDLESIFVYVENKTKLRRSEFYKLYDS
jgi:hypothetical protein